MTINLESLSPAELKALIANAERHLQAAHANQIDEIRTRIDALLKRNDLTLAEVFPTLGGKGTKGPKSPVAPKYRNPSNPDQTWSGRGRSPIWFVEALKKRDVTAEHLLIERKQTAAPKKAAKKAPSKVAKKSSARKKAKA